LAHQPADHQPRRFGFGASSFAVSGAGSDVSVATVSSTGSASPPGSWAGAGSVVASASGARSSGGVASDATSGSGAGFGVLGLRDRLPSAGRFGLFGLWRVGRIGLGCHLWRGGRIIGCCVPRSRFGILCGGVILRIALRITIAVLRLAIFGPVALAASASAPAAAAFLLGLAVFAQLGRRHPRRCHLHPRRLRRPLRLSSSISAASIDTIGAAAVTRRVGGLEFRS
jgi:hypothetical protein